MADPYDAANMGGHDPLRSQDDNYQNLGGLPYENLDPNAPPVGGAPVPPPPPPGMAPMVPSDKAPESNKPPRKGDMVGSGVQELPDSDPSESKHQRVDKPKVKKLKKKIKRAKIIYWVMTFIWVIVLVLFVLIHLNTMNIHVLPFLQKDE